MIQDAPPHAIGGVHFDLIDPDRVAQRIEEWRKNKTRHYICITNPHSVMMCRRDRKMDAVTAGAGLVLPDGIGVILAARLLAYAHQGRVTGPGLMLYLCDKGRAQGWRHYFYGGAKGVADQLAAQLSKRYPGLAVAGACCSVFRPMSPEEDQALVEQINATKPDIVWVGLGTVNQEKWMAAHLGRLTASTMIGVGGAFDVHSGNVPWAPKWIRRCGLEWAYRLALEPRRMWRRNLDSPLFLALVLKQKFSG